MTIYGEIVGYIENDTKMIQKNHDYGCNVGQWKFMPYRITITATNGAKTEFNINEVQDWTKFILDNCGDVHA